MLYSPEEHIGKNTGCFFLVNFIIIFLLVAIGGTDEEPGIPARIYTLAVAIPSYAVAVRRLHDTGRTGWWVFLTFIPIVGQIIFLIFMVEKGQQGFNKYGADPKMFE